jgi:hypothetical protein
VNIKNNIMKKILTILLVVRTILTYSQNTIDNTFFEKVSYIGAFDGVNDWTDGWTEWDPINANYPAATVTKGNQQFSRATGLHITANETWNGTVLLDGWVYVDDGAVLTIQPGTVIRGTNKSALIIERGGQIMAEGTAAEPVVFTSGQGAGLRYNSDWAGLVICGKAPNNIDGGEGVAEGGIESVFGGTDPHDNSGKLRYVRIEFPGYEIATGKEINGLTLCSVGDATEIDYIQVSHSGDDAYEWFGGTVNARHLVCYATEDDNFDTDLGYIGMVQFGLIARDSTIVDTDAANGFESDNDEPGSYNKPYTGAIFSNISAFGPASSATAPAKLKDKHAEGSAVRLRRNTRLQIYNSIFAGWGNGFRLESNNSYGAAQSDSLTVQNCLIAGARGVYFKTDASAGVNAVRSWFMDDGRNNDTLAASAELMITNPFNYDARNFQPASESPALAGSYWAPVKVKEFGKKENVVLIYPNPLSQTATVRLDNPDNRSYTFSIYNLTGQSTRIIRDITGSEFTFDKGDLVKGVYIYQLRNNTEDYYGKIIIE